MKDLLQNSWNAFSPEIASKYLKSFGFPAKGSKIILMEILKKEFNTNRLSILDLGCGNAQIYEFFKQESISCHYTGVDFSDALLDAGRKANVKDANIRLIKDDVSVLSKLDGNYDVAIYSHVIEMMSSPEASLLRVSKLAKAIIIRFFEPPEFDVDTVELLEMDIGEGQKVPYLRRKMSRDYYRLILTKMNCKHVDIYRDTESKDQIHVLHY
jgi:ubiquinone/menaquinone biosynthesis C-methylase UbiE